MANDRVASRLDALLSMTPLRTTFKDRHQRSASTSKVPRTPTSDQRTDSVTSSPSKYSCHSASCSTTISASEVPTPTDETHSPLIVIDNASPTDTTWTSKYPENDSTTKTPNNNENLPLTNPTLSPTTPFQNPTTTLFDTTRQRFRNGISTLDNLLRYMEAYGPTTCKSYRKGIDSLLENLVAMAKWLVGYLEMARSTTVSMVDEYECGGGGGGIGGDEAWTRSAVVGLRVDLHQYSWKVMKLTMLLREGGGGV
ncbi:hypothetical protein CB0940_03538 [Cercospora beticola]|uniref:Uncharacterized protein n=1 Tax=Cercospora beticola TaxID=122368 RepID=A0A2G5I3D1_CERBT|nr:hypothetical protein CB0940_03538 [Cercospora beticola]PIA99326.1 hypothetical protein CB0940_03538 [Cercospora beticola]WPB00713.1 hypothetical protein RHO25_005333 [Cercospora beticola]CAK1361051.1 unnamed protein product [Cercospora beticola]